MADQYDEYKRLEVATGVTLHECPVCGADAELWQYSRSETAPTNKAVMCSNGERFGPQDAMADDGCLLNMPPDDFYKATIREAVAFWNDYARALMAIQRANRWRRHSALRDTKGASDANQA